MDLGAYATFQTALNSQSFSDFEAVTVGGSRTLNGPMGSYSYTLAGADYTQFGDALSPENQENALPIVPPAPALSSVEYATELVELYWCSLLRDVAFTEYHSHSLAKEAAHELSSMPQYAGPKHNGHVTPALLFRGSYFGEETGPYVSQFFITPTTMGAQPIDQKYVTYKPSIDYMTDLNSWADVQNGVPTGLQNAVDPTRRYLHDGRGLAAFTHVDELFQAYFTTYLVLRSIGAPVNPGNPYVHSATQNGFGTFGPPDFASVLAQVAKIALNAVWYQKWAVHLRHRPESGGGLIHLIKTGTTFDGQPHASVFHSEAVKRSHERYGTYLLSQPFPEGSPAHPAYPTGHGTVGGACITILKFFYDGNYAFPNPVVPSSDGDNLDPWVYDPHVGGPGPLTVNGELHKLAHNVTFGHGIHGGIHWRSDSEVSMLLGEAVAISFLQDLACTYAEPFTVSFTKLDGTPATITNI